MTQDNEREMDFYLDQFRSLAKQKVEVATASMAAVLRRFDAFTPLQLMYQNSEELIDEYFYLAKAIGN